LRSIDLKYEIYGFIAMSCRLSFGLPTLRINFSLPEKLACDRFGELSLINLELKDSFIIGADIFLKSGLSALLLNNALV